MNTEVKLARFCHAITSNRGRMLTSVRAEDGFRLVLKDGVLLIKEGNEPTILVFPSNISCLIVEETKARAGKAKSSTNG